MSSPQMTFDWPEYLAVDVHGNLLVFNTNRQANVQLFYTP